MPVKGSTLSPANRASGVAAMKGLFTLSMFYYRRAKLCILSTAAPVRKSLGSLATDEGNMFHLAEQIRSRAHPDLVRFAEHCDKLASGHPMPRREDFRPSDVSWMLGHLFIVDVVDDGEDYCFRLFGDFWQTILGFDLTGQRLSGLESFGFLTALRPEYASVVATQKPQFHPGKLVWPDGKTIDYQRLLIPFSREGNQVSLILGAAHCENEIEDLILFVGQGLPQLVLETQSD